MPEVWFVSSKEGCLLRLLGSCKVWTAYSLWSGCSHWSCETGQFEGIISQCGVSCMVRTYTCNEQGRMQCNCSVNTVPDVSNLLDTVPLYPYCVCSNSFADDSFEPLLQHAVYQLVSWDTNLGWKRREYYWEYPSINVKHVHVLVRLSVTKRGTKNKGQLMGAFVLVFRSWK